MTAQGRRWECVGCGSAGHLQSECRDRCKCHEFMSIVQVDNDRVFCWVDAIGGVEAVAHKPTLEFDWGSDEIVKIIDHCPAYTRPQD